MRSLKAINEEWNELAIEAETVADAKAKGLRDLTPTNEKQFDLITKELLPRLKTERAEAEQNERNILSYSNSLRGSNSTRPEQNMYVNNQTFGQNFPQTVLPVNGVLPGDQQRRYQPFGRMAKLKAFRDDQSAFDSAMWYRAVLSREVNRTIDNRSEDYCRNAGMEITNTSYEGSGPAGGYLLPVPISQAIIEVRERVGIARQVANVLPTNGDTLTVPKKTGGLTVYIVPETVAITDSDKTWGSVGLHVKGRKCLSYLSQELAEDSMINLVDNIVSEQGYALALQEDDELVNGTGASTYGGIRGLLSSIGTAGVSTAATGHDTWPELDIADMTACIGKLPDRYFPYEPSWICSHSFFNSVMMRIAFNAGGVTASEVMQGTPNVRSFLGYRVYLTSKMPVATAASTECALFGAFNQGVILADRGAIRLQRSDDIKFVEDLIALKAVSRYDVAVHDAGDASNAGAYVALATAS